MVEIKNTIRFAFPTDSARPSYEEIAGFVKSLDRWSITDMDTLYKRAENHSVYLKFKSEKAFKDALENNTQVLRFHYANGTTVVVEMSDAEGNFQYVRVCDLPPELPDQEISQVLRKYGKIKRVVREKFPAGLELDIFNGVRGVYMDVKTEIPSALHFLNWRGNIFYPGNKEKCFICAQKGHQMNACPKKEQRTQRNTESGLVAQPSTYAGVLNAATPLHANNEVMEILEIEVLEEKTMDKDVRVEEQEQKSSSSPSVIRCWKSEGKLYTQYAGVKQIMVEDMDNMQKRRDMEAKAARTASPAKEKKHRISTRLSSVGSKSDISD